MALTDTRKTWLATTFFSGNVISSLGLLRAIKSDLQNDTDVGVADVEWIWSALGSTYTPPIVGLEITGKVITINSGTNISVLMDCLSGQVCSLTPRNIILQGVVTTADNDAQARDWMVLHLPLGSNVILTPIGSTYIVTKGTENINNSLATYIATLPLVTPITGSTVSARVISITDGDSFEASQVCAAGQLCVTTPFRVRLEGVSSGELSYPNGRTAKTWLTDKIPPGTVIKLVIKGSDSYGRQVCQVYYPDTVNINQLAILEGQGKVWVPGAESIAGKQIGIQQSSCISSNAAVELLPTLELVGPPTPCNYVKAAPDGTWFRYTVRNNGNAPFVGWLGVILHGSAGDFEYTGTPQYAQTVPAGGEVILQTKVVVPANIGNLRSWDAVINSK
jgi:endonuclease YncB( thermonuclease family)